MQGGSSAPHHRMRTSAEILQAQVARVDDKDLLLSRREQFSDETRSATTINDELAQAAAAAEPIFAEDGSTAPAPFANEDARSYQLKIVHELRNKYPGGRHDDIPLRALADMDATAFSATVKEILEDKMAAASRYAAPLRPDLNQMIVGLVMDQDGRPLCCEMWPATPPT